MSEEQETAKAANTSKPKRAEPRSKWSDAELEAIRDPRMQEFSDPSQFADAMANRTGVIRTMGGYRDKLWEMRQNGVDVSATLYRNFVNVVNAMNRNAKNGVKANGGGSKTNGSNGTSKSSLDSRQWVSAVTLAWLLGVSTKRVHQISSDGRVGRTLLNPGGAQPLYSYSVLDAVTYLRSDARLQSRLATIGETKEILGFTSDAHTKQVVSTFTDPENPDHVRRADVVYLWVNSPRSPATKEDAEKRMRIAHAAAKKKVTNVKRAQSKPVTARPVTKQAAVAKPVKNAKPRPASAIMTPEQVSPLANRPQQHGQHQPNASDLEWMIEGMRRGHLDKQDVAQMVENISKR